MIKIRVEINETENITKEKKKSMKWKAGDFYLKNFFLIFKKLSILKDH